MRNRAIRLELLTIGAVTAESVVGLIAGIAAGSLALISFGLDSVIEFMAAVVVLWQLLGGSERREDMALRVVAFTFCALALYIAVESWDTLRHHHHPDDSVLGIALTSVSLVVMQGLGRAKRRLGHVMENDALEADAAETLLCSYLAFVVLVGLVLNTVAGWWWADPTAALLVAVLAIREGILAWRGGHHQPQRWR
jgi:divalent metal cation (Fe/Co/Zn/Cd) transporter